MRGQKWHQHRELVPDRYAPHAPYVCQLDQAKVVEAMGPEQRARLQELMGLLDGGGKTFSRKLVDADLREKDVQALLDSGVIKRATADDLRSMRGSVKTFLHPEHSKQRARVIMWPKLQNEWSQAMRYRFRGELMDVARLKEFVKSYSWAAVEDLKASFYQWALTPSQQQLYYFKWRGEPFVMRKLLMGHTVAPEVQQLVSSVIFSSAATRTVHIDNAFLGASTSDQIVEARKHIRDTANRCGATLNNPQDTSAVQQLEMFNCLCDLREKTVEISQKTRSKLETALIELNKAKTLGDWFGVFGLAFYASEITEVPLAQFFRAIKWYRVLAHRYTVGILDLDSPCPAWLSALPELNMWLKLLIAAQPTSLKAPQNNAAILYTDASLSGFGAVLVANGTITTVSGPWGPRERQQHINCLEVRAVGRAIERLVSDRKIAPHDSIFLYVDNTVAKAGIIKKRSPSYHVNKEVLNLLNLLDKQDVSIQEVKYVKSAENPADRYSREYAPSSHNLVTQGGVGQRKNNTPPLES